MINKINLAESTSERQKKIEKTQGQLHCLQELVRELVRLGANTQVR